MSTASRASPSSASSMRRATASRVSRRSGGLVLVRQVHDRTTAGWSVKQASVQRNASRARRTVHRERQPQVLEQRALRDPASAAQDRDSTLGQQRAPFSGQTNERRRWITLDLRGRYPIVSGVTPDPSEHTRRVLERLAVLDEDPPGRVLAPRPAHHPTAYAPGSQRHWADGALPAIPAPRSGVCRRARVRAHVASRARGRGRTRATTAREPRPRRPCRPRA